MRRINLLPWRERRQREQQQRFTRHTALLLSTALAVVVLVYLQLEAQLGEQQRRNQFLRSQIAATSSPTTANGATLQGYFSTQRQTMVRALDALARAVPEGVVLNGIKQSGTVLELSGEAGSNAQVASLLRNLDRSPGLAHARLGSLQAATGAEGGARSNRFVVEVDIVQPGGGS